MERTKEYGVHVFINGMEIAYYIGIHSFRVSGKKDLWFIDENGNDFGALPLDVYKNNMRVNFKSKNCKHIMYSIYITK